MNDSMEVSNKIITAEMLSEIFDKMNEKIEYFKHIAREEERSNSVLDYQYQHYTYKDYGTYLTFNVEYDDNTTIKYDNYINFLVTFQNRLEDIKQIDVSLGLNYSVKQQGMPIQTYNQHIYMYIYENKANMSFSLDSSDKKIDDIYFFIKEKIQTSPTKYDEVIKKKGVITNSISFARGFIPAIILCIALLFIKELRMVTAATYILFPMAVIFLSFMIGSTIFRPFITNLYKNIIPKLEYAGYSQNSGSIYKENVDKYIETSEILIGKNINNMIKRNTINEKYNKYKNYILYELIILIIVSIVVVFL